MAKVKVSKRLKAQIDRKRSSKGSDPVSSEEFDAALTSILDEATTAELLSIPGVYEVVSEHYNNDALKLAIENREDD